MSMCGCFRNSECRPGDVVGPIALDAANELGLPTSVQVIAGGLDSFLASIGSGLCEPGDACLNTGSASVVALLARPGSTGRFEWAGYPLLSRPIRAAGRMLRWAAPANISDDAFAELLSSAARLRASVSMHRLLPELVHAAYACETDLRAHVNDVSKQHTPSETIRLLLDAIFLRQRQVLTEMEGESQPARKIRSVGGLAASADVVQLQADVLGRALEVPRTTASGTLGAAMLAATALGFYTSQAAAAARMAQIERRYEPRAEMAEAYDDLCNENRAASANQAS